MYSPGNGIRIFHGGGISLKPNVLEEKMKLNWIFQTGVEGGGGSNTKKHPGGGGEGWWIFPGAIHSG